MERTFVVDRIEEDTLILIAQDSGQSFQVPTTMFPFLKEGDVLQTKKDTDATQKVQAAMQDRLDQLKAKTQQPKKGDVIDL